MAAVLNTSKAEDGQDNMPLLVHSDLVVMDSKGQVIDPLYMKLRIKLTKIQLRYGWDSKQQ